MTESCCLTSWLQGAGDWFTDLTGWNCVPVPLERASKPSEVALDIPGYAQINSYACGAVAAAMVARFFRPELSVAEICETIHPKPRHGTGIGKLGKGLRKLELTVSKRTDMDFEVLKKSIDDGHPVIVPIHNPGSEDDHWAVVYGYGKHRRVFLAGNNIPLIERNRISWKRFNRLWSSRGVGIVARLCPNNH